MMETLKHKICCHSNGESDVESACALNVIHDDSHGPSYTLCLECTSNMILRISHELKYLDFKKTNNLYPLDSEVGTSHKREKEFFNNAFCPTSSHSPSS